MEHSPERRKKSRVSCFSLQSEDGGFIPVWSYHDEADNAIPCLIIDISEQGCSMLINKEHPLPAEQCTIRFFDQDLAPLAEISLCPTLRWSDDNYSIENRLIGVEFTGDIASQQDILLSLIDKIAQQQPKFIRCLIQ